jgi:hypothetical protein
VEGHCDDAESAQGAVFAVVAREATEEIAHRPGHQGAGHQKPDRPWDRTADQNRDRRRKGGERGSEIEDQHPPPVVQILLEEVALDPIELSQRRPHHVDSLGARVPEGSHRRDHLLDRVDRGEMGDEKGERDSHEDDQCEQRQALDDVYAVVSHRPLRGVLRY